MTFFPQQAGCHLASVRGTEITLRLQRHAVRHGTFPDTLDALVGDPGSAVPADPLPATDFLYHPAGLPQRLEIKDVTGPTGGVIPPRTAPAEVGPGDTRLFTNAREDDHLEAVSRETPQADRLPAGRRLFGQLDKPDQKRVRFLMLD